MSTDDRDLVRFPSPPPAILAPRSDEEPRGVSNLPDQQRAAANATTELISTPGAADAQQSVFHRKMQMETIRSQDYSFVAAVARDAMHGMAWGVAAGLARALLLHHFAQARS